MLAHKPVLRGERVVLRPFRPEDVPALWRMLHEPECMRLTGSRTTFPREAVEAWYAGRNEAPDRLDLAIADAATDACLGEVVLNEYAPHDRACNFRISLAGPELFGRGLGTEATRLMLGHAFETVGLHRVGLEVYDFNPRARRAYEKAGFVTEGVRRQVLLWEGTWYDSVVMSVLAPEWAALNGRPLAAASRPGPRY
ncbi:GNAT family N-acetyltransferase [Pyxidicoccus fallax]|uniref:GNAT family N-acetyltransferase n=1 Tax=Pyxidicoccus fallax TaxID=394095 RepID=A0A848LXK3_9BACT|nr:GNAT family protein [Pyxidicoccus fallax]NMO22330.1 GNAT family N-acetyltransferase [Pyxidicoccus fallax]NPC84030.1 GNAT family N-acetyltransferase [Pyxidicoccus fallax]